MKHRGRRTPERFTLDGEDPATAALAAEHRRAERAIAAVKGELRDVRSQLTRAEKERDQWEERFQALAAIKEPLEPHPIFSRAPAASADNTGVMLAAWSDWHVAEVVEKSKVRGLNAFSPEIAARRAAQCAASTLAIWRHLAKSYSMDTLVLFLGGDFGSGWIHEELAQTNEMGPVEEARYAETLLKSSIELLANERSLRRLRIVAMRGNHFRTTRRMQFKNDYETSYESWIYWHLRDLLASKKVQWDIPHGDVHLTEILPGWALRTFHGHQIRYQDGVGGLTIPLNKWVARQDSTQPAALNLFGHWHHYGQPSGRAILNGSLKGFDEMGASLGFAFQPPLQAAALLDLRRRLIAQHLPIFCD